MRFVRLVVVGFIVLSALYLAVSVYSRSVRREKLEKEWDGDPPEGAASEAREKFIEDGMAIYESSLRKRLILLIYVVPPIVAGAIILTIN